VRLASFWIAHRAELAGMLQQHVLLVLLSTGVAILLGVPAGIVAAHRPRIGRPLVAAVNIGQTIPSLALLGFLIPLPLVGGVGPRAAIVALILYALLPIVRMTAAGVQGVDRAVRDAAVAMGMTPRQLLTMVELPLALPSIVAGIRVATVVGVGTATIAAFIGAGGLGEYIFRGLSMVDGTMILAGAVPAAALALLADAILSRVERQLSPARSRAPRRRWLAAGAAAVAIAAFAMIPSAARDGDRIVIGSKNFTEQVILGELVAQLLERDTDLHVVRKLNLGGTFICDRAIRTGDIDVYVEYTGTALTAIFRQPVAHDRAAVLAATRQLYADAGLTALDALGFNNTFAILVRRQDAEKMGLRTIGDLRQMDRWRAGFGYEFLQREDGYRGMVTRYDLRFREEPRVMDLTLMYRALASGHIDVIAGDATSGLIDALDLQALEDDRRYFPPYDAVPVVRSAVLLRRPDLGRVLAILAGAVSEQDMRSMNRAVDLDHRDPAEVVRQFMGTLNISQKPDTRTIARCPQFEKC
jgi:osmoprotectant transport system permease protein